jgi:hypothetical protein
MRGHALVSWRSSGSRAGTTLEGLETVVRARGRAHFQSSIWYESGRLNYDRSGERGRAAKVVGSVRLWVASAKRGDGFDDCDQGANVDIGVGTFVRRGKALIVGGAFRRCSDEIAQHVVLEMCACG